MKTLTIIYLKEQEKTKLKRLTEIKLFNNPSKEKILKLDGLIVTIEFILVINCEKDILE